MADQQTERLKLPARASRGGYPSPPPNRLARAGFYLLVTGALLSGIAVTFELGRYQGHREGIAYAEQKSELIDEALETLELARMNTEECHDIARYLEAAPRLKGSWRLRLAKRTLEEPCKNCGGGP